MNKLKEWMMEEESGQGLVEYALIIVLISVALIAGLTNMKTAIGKVFDKITKTMAVTP